jgi:hypothetical protein
LGEDKIKRI